MGYDTIRPNLVCQVVISIDDLKNRDERIREEMLALFRGKHRDYANEIEQEMEQAK